MKELTDEVKKQIKEIFSGKIYEYDNIIEIDLASGMYNTNNIGIQDLKKLSEILETTNINMFTGSGWSGSGITPGDPARIKIKCRPEEGNG